MPTGIDNLTQIDANNLPMGWVTRESEEPTGIWFIDPQGRERAFRTAHGKTYVPGRFCISAGDGVLDAEQPEANRVIHVADDYYDAIKWLDYHYPNWHDSEAYWS